MINRGFYGIGIYDAKKGVNVGTLLRSALAFSANFVFTIGSRYKKDKSNAPKAERHIPLWQFETFEKFHKNKPLGCQLVGIEYKQERSLVGFTHPERAVYILGAEDGGLPPNVLEKCDYTLDIPTSVCLNVATTGSIVMFDRVSKQIKNLGAHLK